MRGTEGIMTVDERYRRLHRKLEDMPGVEGAGTLMGALYTPRLETELLRRDLQMLETRMDARFSQVKTELAQLEARVLDKLNEQTKTLFRTFIVSNAAMILAVATLAFGRALLP
jgi:hypothetical protein